MIFHFIFFFLFSEQTDLLNSTESLGRQLAIIIHIHIAQILHCQKMLKQILNDMYVDPELLSGLDEYQKQTLFCKMREEQIRRWRIREQQNDKQALNERKQQMSKKKKNVTFREDNEGEPWVIVIEPTNWSDYDSDDNINCNDKPYDDILTKEAKQRARELAEIETIEIRQKYKAELNEIFTDYESKIEKKISDEDPLGSPIIDDLEIYCSVDELRERMNQSNKTPPSAPSIQMNFKQNNNILNNRIINFSLNTDSQNEKNVILKEISNTKPSQKVSAKIALWEQRVIGEKTNEIYLRLKKKQKEAAQEEAKKQEEAYAEQERKAKEADIQFREIARRAREEHRKSLTEANCNNLTATKNTQNNRNTINGIMTTQTSPPSSLDSLIPKPANQEAMIKWYREVEIQKGAGLESIILRSPCKWFHGLLTRTDAENLLELEPTGTFLVRLSEKIWGYAISYKDVDRCKHYLINASSGKYQFLGSSQVTHDSLSKFPLNY